MDEKNIVLVAEDDKFLLSAYKIKLEKEGLTVLGATTGNEVIDIMQKSNVKVVLLDLIMPEKDGFETLAEIRKNSKWAKIPVLVVSNLGQKEDRDKAVTLGADGYIVKSDVSLSEIVDQVKARLG